MPDYKNVIPDVVNILGKNFTPGRGGRRIKYVVLHHTAGILNAKTINDVWFTRPASAHYLAAEDVISQHVWDRDTAWANADWVANSESITIEHSNSGGPAQDWPISEKTLITGARWTAALCFFYKLGRPEWNKNVRGHYQFFATSCPYHLRAGHKYHTTYMQEAQKFYDFLSNPVLATPALQPTISSPEEDIFMALTHDEQHELLRKVRELHNALLAPVPSKVEGSTFKASRVDFIDLLDRKVEELHVEYSGKSSHTQREMDALQASSDAHDPADEATHHAH